MTRLPRSPSNLSNQYINYYIVYGLSFIANHAIGYCGIRNIIPSLTRFRPEILIVSGRTNTSTEDISLFFLTIMFFLITSRHRLFLKCKWSSLDNKIFFCTCCVAFGVTDYEIIEDNTYYYNYIVVGYSCDHKVSEQHFQTINRKRKRIEAEIFKTYEEYLRTISKLS